MTPRNVIGKLVLWFIRGAKTSRELQQEALHEEERSKMSKISSLKYDLQDWEMELARVERARSQLLQQIEGNRAQISMLSGTQYEPEPSQTDHTP